MLELRTGTDDDAAHDAAMDVRLRELGALEASPALQTIAGAD